MREKFFSIIVLNHNNLYIKHCIESIKKYKHHNDEIIVIDDHSTKSNYNELLKYADSTCHILQNETHPANLSYSRNLGVKHAQYDYLLFLDGDAFFYDDCINQLRNAFSFENIVCATPFADGMSIAPLQLELVYKENFDEYLEDNKLSLLCNKFFVKDYRRNLSITVLQSDYNWCYFYGICLAVKKDAFFKAGQFDDKLSGWGIEDLDFTFRLKKHGKLLFVPEAHLFHIPHIRNRYRNHEQNAYNYIECLKKYEGYIEWEAHYRLRNLSEVMSIIEQIRYLHRNLYQQMPIENKDDIIYIFAISGEFPNGNIVIYKKEKRYCFNYVGLGLPFKNKQFKECVLSIFVFNYPAPMLSILLQEACRIAGEVKVHKTTFVPSFRWGSDIEKKCETHSQRFEFFPIKLSDFIFKDEGTHYKITTSLPDTPYQKEKGVYYEFI